MPVARRLSLAAAVACVAVLMSIAAPAGSTTATRASQTATRPIAFLPLGDFPRSEASSLARHFTGTLGVRARVAPGAALPRSAFNGGQAVAVGVPAPNATVDARVTNFTHVERTLTGSRAGSHRPHWDIPLIVQAYKQGLIKLDELVSAKYPLDDWEHATHDLHEGKLARGVLTVSAA